MTALQTVHVRVNDAATGQPTPCRIRFTDGAGSYHAPFGRLARFATEAGVDVGGNVLLEGHAHAYIDGACEVPLPPGRLSVTISKGLEYRPIQSEVFLAPGKLALRFELERWTDPQAENWYSGETRCHDLTPHAALLEAAAEDLAVVNVLCREAPAAGSQEEGLHALSNIQAFSGQNPALERSGHLVVVGTSNRHPVLGELLLLNCHRVVYPLTFGGPGGFDNWTLAAWCDQCHRKGGLVIGEGFFDASPKNHLGELLADVILGKVDALQVYSWNAETSLEPWYALLDLGLRVPLTAGSGKESNRQALGMPRTYARLLPGQKFTYRNWIEAVRAGRTFVTSGPLLLLTVNGQDPGAVLELPASAPPLRVRAEARSPGPIEALEIVANRQVVSRTQPGPTSPFVETELTLPAGGWLFARCRGPTGEALTSPVYVHVPGRPSPNASVARVELTHSLDNMLAWIDREGRFENDSQRARLAGIFQDARARLSKLS